MILPRLGNKTGFLRLSSSKHANIAPPGTASAGDRFGNFFPLWVPRGDFFLFSCVDSWGRTCCCCPRSLQTLMTLQANVGTHTGTRARYVRCNDLSDASNAITAAAATAARRNRVNKKATWDYGGGNGTQMRRADFKRDHHSSETQSLCLLLLGFFPDSGIRRDFFVSLFTYWWCLYLLLLLLRLMTGKMSWL